MWKLIWNKKKALQFLTKSKYSNISSLCAVLSVRPLLGTQFWAGQTVIAAVDHIQWQLYTHTHTHTHAHTHTQTHPRTPLDKGSERRRSVYLHNTKLSNGTNIHAPGGIRTLNPSKRVAAELTPSKARPPDRL